MIPDTLYEGMGNDLEKLVRYAYGRNEDFVILSEQDDAGETVRYYVLTPRQYLLFKSNIDSFNYKFVAVLWGV